MSPTGRREPGEKGRGTDTGRGQSAPLLFRRGNLSLDAWAIVAAGKTRRSRLAGTSMWKFSHPTTRCPPFRVPLVSNGSPHREEARDRCATSARTHLRSPCPLIRENMAVRIVSSEMLNGRWRGPSPVYSSLCNLCWVFMGRLGSLDGLDAPVASESVSLRESRGGRGIFLFPRAQIAEVYKYTKVGILVGLEIR